MRNDIKQLIASLQAHQPTSILEMGCGSGRLLDPVTSHFSDMPVIGCDISEEMLALCPDTVGVFHYDICDPAFTGVSWDVGFSRGVWGDFDDEQMRTAMGNVRKIIQRKFLVYEGAKICNRMQAIEATNLFEYHVFRGYRTHHDV